MRRLALAGLVLVVLVGAGVWWFVLRDDAPPPAALGDCAAPDGEATTTADGTWTVAPDDAATVFVGYRVDEKFGGETITKTAVGRTGDVEGSLTVDGDQVTEASVLAHLDGLRSDRTARDSAIRTKGLETDQFPEGRFTLTEPIALPASPAIGVGVEATATGRLELHGQEQEVSIPVAACWTGPTIRLSGSAPIVLADYGMDVIQTPIVDIEDHGTVELQLTFAPA